MTESNNKKIIGATEVIYDDVKFKSQLEKTCYKKLTEAGLNFTYEPQKHVLWEGYKLSKTPVYAPKKIRRGKYGKELMLQTRALLDITYTPDFYIQYKDFHIFIDVKGIENDTYPMKKKMFLKELDNSEHKCLFFEPHNVRQIMQTINVIKEL